MAESCDFFGVSIATSTSEGLNALLRTGSCGGYFLGILMAEGGFYFCATNRTGLCGGAGGGCAGGVRRRTGCAADITICITIVVVVMTGCPVGDPHITIGVVIVGCTRCRAGGYSGRIGSVAVGENGRGNCNSNPSFGLIIATCLEQLICCCFCPWCSNNLTCSIRINISSATSSIYSAQRSIYYTINTNQGIFFSALCDKTAFLGCGIPQILVMFISMYKVRLTTFIGS